MVDIVTLKKSDFWKKKFRRAVITRDTDKSGYLTRGDFEVIVERYKKTANTSASKLKAFSESMFSFCDGLGLNNANVKQDYEEFEESWQSLMEQHNYKEMFKYMFVCLDSNEDGFIDFKEWEAHNIALGISSAEAKNSFRAMSSGVADKITMEQFVEYHYEFFFSTENKLNSAILFGPM